MSKTNTVRERCADFRDKKWGSLKKEFAAAFTNLDPKARWSDLNKLLGDDKFPQWFAWTNTYYGDYPCATSAVNGKIPRDDCPVWEIFETYNSPTDPKNEHAHWAKEHTNWIDYALTAFFNLIDKCLDEGYAPSEYYTFSEYNHNPAAVQKLQSLTKDEVALFITAAKAWAETDTVYPQQEQPPTYPQNSIDVATALDIMANEAALLVNSPKTDDPYQMDLRELAALAKTEDEVDIVHRTLIDTLSELPIECLINFLDGLYNTTFAEKAKLDIIHRICEERSDPDVPADQRPPGCSVQFHEAHTPQAPCYITTRICDILPPSTCPY